MAALAVVSLTRTAVAQPAPPPGARPISDLDGLYIALGPLGSATRTQGDWHSGFGGEISLVRVTERRPIAALGLALGGLRFSARDAGRLWGDLSVATRRPLGLAVGLSVGPTVEVDEVLPPRIGGHATLWVFAGVIPYVRVGSVEKSGRFVELGVKLTLPAIRL